MTQQRDTAPATGRYKARATRRYIEAGRQYSDAQSGDAATVAAAKRLGAGNSDDAAA